MGSGESGVIEDPQSETKRELMRHLIGLICALASLLGAEFVRELGRQLWGRNDY